MEQLRDREKVAGLLRQVLETYGEELLDDNHKLNALLMDYMPRYDKERKFLVKALELGIGKELIDARQGSTEERHTALNRCKATLESELLLSEDSAKYLVTVIAKALHRETAEPEKKAEKQADIDKYVTPELQETWERETGLQRQPDSLQTSTSPSSQRQRTIPWRKLGISAVIVALLIAIFVISEKRSVNYVSSVPPKNEIIAVSFCDKVEGDYTWDVPEIAPDAVAWATEEKTGYHLYIGQEGGVIAGERAPRFGKLYPNVRTIQFDRNYDTSNITDMSWMFCSNNSLSELDLSSFDTSNVTNMYNMFFSCNSLSELDLSSFDTSNVTDMSWMFGSCKNLSELNLSSFNTSKVTDMGFMFFFCNNLSELDLSSFNPSNVTDISGMFDACDNLTNLITNDKRLKEQYAEKISN